MEFFTEGTAGSKCVVIVYPLFQLDAASWRCIAFYSFRMPATASIYKRGDALSDQ
jgi:hypothetical protein